MKLTTPQLVARLEYADSLYSWLNVHAEMKAAMTGLIRRGLAVRRQSDEAFNLTDEGRQFLEANKALFSGGFHNEAGPYIHKIVAGAEYWTDAWSQQIPK
jgi:hypothetical protein